MNRISSHVGKICPRCQTPFSEETPVKVCVQCHTPQHAECWDYLEACSVYGCGSRQAKLFAPTTDSDTKSCPYCAETIKTAAIRCKHCHTDLTSQPETRPEASRSGPNYGSGPLVSSAFSYGWKRFTENIGILIGSHVFVGLMGAVVNARFEAWNSGHMYRYSRPWELVLAILFALISAWLAIGMFKINLAIIDGRPAAFRDLFSGGDRLAPFIGASILVGILVGLGTLLFVIPGIILAVFYVFVPLLVVEQNAVLESLGGSWQLVRGSFWSIVGFGLLAFLLNVLGALFFGVGLLLTTPITSLALAYVYRRLQRQSK